MNLQDCIPIDKYGIAAIERAEVVGFPKLNPILPDLLEWIQAINWPVATRTAAVLYGAGPEIVPHIKSVLRSDDDIWKFWITEVLLPASSIGVDEELHSELVRLANHPNYNEKFEAIDISAREFLATCFN